MDVCDWARFGPMAAVGVPLIRRLWRARGRIETVLLLAIAVCAVALEIAGVDNIGGRDPFRVVLPALVTLMSLVLLEVFAELRRIAPNTNESEATRRLLTPDPSQTVQRSIALDVSRP